MNGHIGLIHSILPSTVDLHVKIPDKHPSARNLGSERFGSVTLLDPDGYLLTGHYVTVGAASITVTLSDGEQYPAQIAAEDQETGLSLVKISGHDLPALKLAPPDSVIPGQPVVMIASNGEASRRVSGGYITSTEGYDGQWEYMLDKTIRITASNPWFGGGTLANFRAELLGVVSLNLNEVGKFTLAIPIDYYRTYEHELKQYGQVRSRPRRPWLGIYPQVMAGHIVTAACRDWGEIVPVDSEHSAILQCISGRPGVDVRRVIITASGGPFRQWSAERLEEATLEDALRHPTWRMGRKITVDSATLVEAARHWRA